MGDLIAAIIAIIVLVTLIWIFRESLSSTLSSWFNIIKGVSGSGEDISKEIEKLG